MYHRYGVDYVTVDVRNERYGISRGFRYRIESRIAAKHIKYACGFQRARAFADKHVLTGGIDRVPAVIHEIQPFGEIRPGARPYQIGDLARVASYQIVRSFADDQIRSRINVLADAACLIPLSRSGIVVNARTLSVLSPAQEIDAFLRNDGHRFAITRYAGSEAYHRSVIVIYGKTERVALVIVLGIFDIAFAYEFKRIRIDREYGHERHIRHDVGGACALGNRPETRKGIALAFGRRHVLRQSDGVVEIRLGRIKRFGRLFVGIPGHGKAIESASRDRHRIRRYRRIHYAAVGPGKARKSYFTRRISAVSDYQSGDGVDARQFEARRSYRNRGIVFYLYYVIGVGIGRVGNKHRLRSDPGIVYEIHAEGNVVYVYGIHDTQSERSRHLNAERIRLIGSRIVLVSYIPCAGISRAFFDGGSGVLGQDAARVDAQSFDIAARVVQEYDRILSDPVGVKMQHGRGRLIGVEFVYGIQHSLFDQRFRRQKRFSAPLRGTASFGIPTVETVIRSGRRLVKYRIRSVCYRLLRERGIGIRFIEIDDIHVGGICGIDVGVGGYSRVEIVVPARKRIARARRNDRRHGSVFHIRDRLCRDDRGAVESIERNGINVFLVTRIQRDIRVDVGQRRLGRGGTGNVVPHAAVTFDVRYVPGSIRSALRHADNGIKPVFRAVMNNLVGALFGNDYRRGNVSGNLIEFRPAGI